MFNKLTQLVKVKILGYKKNNSLEGRWRLIEYYTEPQGKLINIKESEVISGNHKWDIEFVEGGKFSSTSNLDIGIVKQIKPCTWKQSRNFVMLINYNSLFENIEFQFAFEKGNLKLLKKDNTGKIIVFAFFKRIPRATSL